MPNPNIDRNPPPKKKAAKKKKGLEEKVTRVSGQAHPQLRRISRTA